MVFKINKAEDYIVMSNYHLRDNNLSLRAKGLLSLMFDLPRKWDYSIKGLCQICKEGRDSIIAILNELRDSGYLEIESFRDSKGRYKSIYNIYEVPIRDNRYGLADTVNPTQYNSSSNNKYKLINNSAYNIYNNRTIIYSSNHKERIEKEINKEKDKKENISNEYNNFELYSFLEQNFGRSLSPIEIELVQTWEDTELTRYAIKQAILNCKYNLKYINTILDEYKHKSIKTVQQAQAEEEEYKRKHSKKSKNDKWEELWKDKK